MVRQCVVDSCMESDKTLLTHRFPKAADMLKSWQISLNLQKISLDDLHRKFAVCTKHFAASAYRNEISNSLNTTAIPNLKNNSDNERVFTTSIAVRNQITAPTRCHKPVTSLSLQKSAQFVRIVTAADHAVKRMKFDKSDSVSYSVDDESQEEPEMFEIYEPAEEDSTRLNEDLPPAQIPAVSQNQETQTDPIEPETEEKVETCTIETQTDTLPVKEFPVQNPEAKDDKLITILYPEFSGMNKIQLIELVNERSRKIESLEDKVVKLEKAMRNLL